MTCTQSQRAAGNEGNVYQHPVVAAQNSMTQQGVTSLGDRGNVYHTQQLDVAAQDTVRQQGVTPLGGRGNVYHLSLIHI